MEEKVKYEDNRILFFHDETTINLGGSVHALWTLKGKKKYILSSGSKNRLIISGVVNRFTGETLLNTSEKMDSDDFIDFLILVLGHYHDKLIDIVVDNASWHKSKKIKKFLNENSRITLTYLPPYSSELNPIEKFWNILKHSIWKNKYYKKIKDLDFEIKRFGTISNENKNMGLELVLFNRPISSAINNTLLRDRKRDNKIKTLLTSFLWYNHKMMIK